LLAAGPGVVKVVPGYRRPVGSAKIGRALLVSGGRPVARYRRAVDDGGLLFLAIVFARESVHSAAASGSVVCPPAPAMAGTEAATSVASSGRASQTSCSGNSGRYGQTRPR